MRISLLDQLQRPILGRPHLLADPLLQIIIVCGDTLLLRQVIFDRFLNDVLGDLNTDFSHVLDIRQKSGSCVINDRGCGSQSLNGGD
jgi:hypothetical protein